MDVAYGCGSFCFRREAWDGYKYNLNFTTPTVHQNGFPGNSCFKLCNYMIEKTFTEDYWDSWEKYYSAFDRSKVQVIADD